MKNKNAIAAALGIDPEAAADMPHRICKHAFFEHLAQHGISVQSEAEANRYIEASDALESKVAAIRQKRDPVGKALDGLLGKQAGAPQADQQRAQILNQLREAPDLQQYAAQKTAALLNDPVVFGSVMSAFLDE